MKEEEFHGYVAGIKLARLGNAPVVKLSIIKPGGQLLEMHIHSPPDWLTAGLAVEGKYYVAETRSGKALIVSSIASTRQLKPAQLRRITIEHVERASDGELLIEGRRDDGGFFSSKLSRAGGSTGPAYGVFVEVGGLYRLVATIPLREFESIRRAQEFVALLRKKELESPEKDYLAKSVSP